jgi:hypothetical protein
MVLLTAAAGVQGALDFTGSNFSLAEQAQIRAAYLQAQAAVANALFYLKGNGATNLHGQHPAFNRFFGSIYDQTATSPLNATDLALHKRNLVSPYRLVHQRPIGEGIGTTTDFDFIPTPLYFDTPLVGDEVYITPFDRLYPDPLRHPTYGSFIVSGVSTTQIQNGSGNNQNQQEVLDNITYLRPQPFYPIYSPFLDGPLETVRPVIGDALSLDAVRYRQLVMIMEKVQYALQNVDINVRDDYTSTSIYDNSALRTFYNPFSTPVLRNNFGLFGPGGFDDRGIEKYGLSTSANANGTLAWIDDPNFFDEKFGALAQDTSFFIGSAINILSLNQTDADLWIGTSALTGVETLQNGLFDGTDHSGETQASDPLYVHILKAITEMVASGLAEQQLYNGLEGFNAEPTWNRDAYNALGGSPSQDLITGDFLPGDLDLANIIKLLTDTIPIQQGGSANAAAGPPPGKQAFAGNSFANDGVNSGFGNNIVIPLP